MKVTLKADVERYGDIAERWPLTITVEGTEAQLQHFFDHGVYVAGCDDLYVEVSRTEL